MCKISVIVPVYNIEHYLERCVNSLATQSYTNLEIILVDDGSTDSSGLRCDALAQNDSRIRVIHQANGGPGMARNAGLDAATGDYVSFIDGDDYLDTGAYEKAVQILKEYAPDVVRFGYQKMNNGRVAAERIMDYPEGLYTGEGLEKMKLDTISFANVLDHDRQRILSSCTNVFDRNFLEEHHLRFLSERRILNEDYLFVVQVMQLARRVYMLPEAYYHYDTRSNSITTTYHQQMYQRKMALYDTYRSILPTDDPEVAARLDNFYIDCIYGCMINECVMGGHWRQAVGKIRKLLHDDGLKRALRRSKGRIKSLKSWVICTLMRCRMAWLCYAGYNLMRNPKR